MDETILTRVERANHPHTILYVDNTLIYAGTEIPTERWLAIIERYDIDATISTEAHIPTEMSPNKLSELDV